MATATAVREPEVRQEAAVDPLDVPYAPGEAPVYTNPLFPDQIIYIHEKDASGNIILAWKGKFVAGKARYSTPRQEGYIRAHLQKLLNGNNPDRWKGEDLDEADRYVCQCSFNTLNTKAGNDHRKYHKHLPVI